MLGATLREARLAAGVSQRSLAIRAGVTQASVSRIERGLEAPSWERFERLMLSLGLRVGIDITPLEHRIDPAELRIGASMSPAERLAEAASWNRVSTALTAAARRG
jgi:transcriptional regulator with XRE-family HTH domain